MLKALSITSNKGKLKQNRSTLSELSYKNHLTAAAAGKCRHCLPYYMIRGRQVCYCLALRLEWAR